VLPAVAIAVLTACSTRVAGTGNARHGPSCPGPSTTAIVSCLQTSLANYWSQVLAQKVSVQVVLAPATADVPRDCRDAVLVHTAFTCSSDDRVYVTAPYIARLRSATPAADVSYRFAATLGHEMGHVVQFAVHAPLVENDHPSAAQSQQIEQQADCLSGVWAAGVGLDMSRFIAAANEVFELIDSDFERTLHGTPAVRIGAVERGANGASPHSCGLAAG
jgi:predicted metalloprotease